MDSRSQTHRHVDGALMMGYHHRGEVGIRIAGGCDVHAGHHPVHRRSVLGEKLRFAGGRRLGAQAERTGKAHPDRDDQHWYFSGRSKLQYLISQATFRALGGANTSAERVIGDHDSNKLRLRLAPPPGGAIGEAAYHNFHGS